MRQTAFKWLLAIALCLVSIACDEGVSQTAPATGTIVSLSPAATDLLVAMGLKPRVVGVSNYEADAEMRKLPKVGDYQKIDWEKLAELKPSLLILQGKRDRLPPGIRERAEGMGIKVMILQIDRFSDILSETARIGEFANADDAAAALRMRMGNDLEKLRAADVKKSPAMIVLNDSGTAVVGRDNFLNDLLEAAGGENVITANGYVTIDGEKMRSLNPTHVFLLMPDGPDSAIEAAKKQIDLAAVREGRLHVIRTSDALLPASGTVKLAQTMAEKLSASSTTQPTTSPTGANARP